MIQRRICTTVEAKANLNKLLDYVTAGEEIIIRRRGKIIAKMIPAAESKMDEARQVKELMHQLRNFHQRVRQKHGARSDTVALLRDLRRESR